MALSKRCLFIAIAMVMITQLSAFGVQSDSKCSNVTPDLYKLFLQCQKAIEYDVPQVEPSEDCCKAFKEVDLPCCCKHIPEGFEVAVRMEKFAYCATKCGCPLQSGSKCGTYHVPMA